MLNMPQVTDWKVVQKLQSCNKCHLIIGAVIGVLLITLLVLAIIFKAKLIKKLSGCCDDYDLDLDEEYLDFDDEDDEDEFI